MVPIIKTCTPENRTFGSYLPFMNLFAPHAEPGACEPVDGHAKPIMVTKWGAPSPDVPACLQRVSLRRHRADVLPQLPEKRYQVVPVEQVPSEAKHVCDQLVARPPEAGADLNPPE